jgi:hypothetical protein
MTSNPDKNAPRYTLAPKAGEPVERARAHVSYLLALSDQDWEMLSAESPDLLERLRDALGCATPALPERGVEATLEELSRTLTMLRKSIDDLQDRRMALENCDHAIALLAALPSMGGGEEQGSSVAESADAPCSAAATGAGDQTGGDHA